MTSISFELNPYLNCLQSSNVLTIRILSTNHLHVMCIKTKKPMLCLKGGFLCSVTKQSLFTQCVVCSCQKYLNCMKNLKGFPSKYVYKPSWTMYLFKGWLFLELLKLFHMFGILLLRPQRDFFAFTVCEKLYSHCKRDAFPESSHLVKTLSLN